MRYICLLSILLALAFASKSDLQTAVSKVFDGLKPAHDLFPYLYHAHQNRDLSTLKYILDLGVLPRDAPELRNLLDDSYEQEYWDALYAFISGRSIEDIEGPRSSLINIYHRGKKDLFCTVLEIVDPADPFLETLKLIIDDEDSEFYKMILDHQKASNGDARVPSTTTSSDMTLVAYAIPNRSFGEPFEINLATEAQYCHYVHTSDPHIFGVLFADIGELEDAFPNPELLLTTEKCRDWVESLKDNIPEISGSFARFGPSHQLDIFTFGRVVEPYAKILVMRPAFDGSCGKERYTLVPEIQKLDELYKLSYFYKPIEISMILQKGDVILFIPNSINFNIGIISSLIMDLDPENPDQNLSAIRGITKDSMAPLTVVLVK